MARETPRTLGNKTVTLKSMPIPTLSEGGKKKKRIQRCKKKGREHAKKRKEKRKKNAREGRGKIYTRKTQGHNRTGNQLGKKKLEQPVLLNVARMKKSGAALPLQSVIRNNASQEGGKTGKRGKSHSGGGQTGRVKL